MPIRSPRGRAAAYRALWQWPLRSPARLAVTSVVVAALAVGVSFAVAATASDRDGGTTAASPTSTDPSGRSSPRSSGRSATPTPTMLPPVPELEPTTLPLSQAPAAALDVAARWAAAWLRPAEGTTAQQWVEGLRPTTTEEYLGVLSGVDPGNIPATRVTGEPRPVRVAANSVQVDVPTDALTLRVLVVQTEEGWRVSGYDRV
ncbi:hypothetical protein [Pseudonocardia nigra]|uniref:hypothetical protein n=1 Tax=Pseudonocardia nigra TaxID=1921578 RepID=UPI001C5EC1E2|nr:hypothetical protein [Pseudonocardia nigra]